MRASTSFAASARSAAVLVALAGSFRALGASPFAASINLSSLNGATGFVLNGIDTIERSGFSVASAGDVNGDGIDDLIIGAMEASQNNDLFAGRTYVVFGTTAGVAASINLSTLNGANGFVLNGINPGDRSGRSVASAGDVNGDGIGDLIIGAYTADPYNEGSAGDVYVIFGRDTAVQGAFAASIDIAALLNGDDAFLLYGTDPFDYAGIFVASAGDVNGDGVGDMIIGASGGDPGGRSGAGEVYVVFGKDVTTEGGFEPLIALSSLNGTTGFVLNGIDAGDAAGGSVAAAGDVNGDGIDDLIIGARFADPNARPNAGESYVVFGRNTAVNGPFASSIELSSLNGATGFVLNGINSGDNAGFSVASAGDVDGDGIDDLIIGAYLAAANGQAQGGESYVVFGRNTAAVGPFAASINLSSLNGTTGFRLIGIDASDRSGVSVASAGDVNADGIGDVIIGATLADPNAVSNAGESYVVFGRDTAVAGPFASSINLSTLNGETGFVLNGVDSSDLSGRSVASAGDVNGDGIGDLIIGAYGADPNGEFNAGESYVVFGRLSQYWTSVAGGAWDTGSKWFSGSAPRRGTVVIDTSIGVTVTGPADAVFLDRLTLGADAGRTTLNLAPNSYVEITQALDIPSSAGLGGSGVLVADAGIANDGVITPADLVVVSAAGVTNAGDIRLISAGPAPASLTLYGALTTDPGASITVFGVALLAADAITNEGDADISFAFAAIDGPVTNAGIPDGPGFDPLGTITISGASSVVFESDLVNQSEIVLTSDSSIVILGELSGNGVSGPGGGPGGTVFAKGGFDPGFLLQTVVASFGGDLTLDAGTLTTIEIGGAVPGTSHDQITSLGVIGAAGTLEVSLINGYVPQPGDEYFILDAASITGAFSAIVLDPALASANADTSTLYTDGTIRIPTPSCAGDVNGDGDTNALDFNILAGNFGASVTPNTSGDLNGDGVVNALDFNILAGDFGCGG